MLAETPLEAKMKIMVRTISKMGSLTGYMSACLELGCHFGIHLDHHVSLFSHGLVPFLLAVVDPVPKFVSDDGSTDIDDPLLWNLVQIRFVGQEVEDLWMVASKVHDVVQSQVLVLRHVQSLDCIILEAKLFPITYVSKEIDGDVL